jgi:trk system potassium uptake protein TrkH
MRLRNVFWVLGLVLRPFAVLLLLPAAVDFYYGAELCALTFVGVALLAFLLGSQLRLLRGRAEEMGRLEAMAVVASSWLFAALLGAIPYVQQGLGVVDSFFESMSGFTTTGSTILQAWHWEGLSRGLFFWRAMTQWLGGMGIIVLFVAILPALAVAGRQMFFAEAPGPEEAALTPRIRHTAVALWKLYIGLTLLEATLLSLFSRMTVYEGICHAFTTMAAGGFSPHARSLAGYGAAAQWIVLPFMFLAGASFALQYRALFRPRVVGRDTEFRTYALLILFAGLMIGVIIAGSAGHDFEASLRHGLFQATSILTTTGYASEDFNQWPQGALMVLGALMFIGGCAGSAGGGPKVIRLIILIKFLARELLIVLHPRAVRMLRVNRRPLPTETMRQIVGFIVAYLTVFAVVALLAGIIEDDLRIGMTGSIVTLGNIGPGYGAIGPMETFAHLSPLTKLLFAFAMWVGRLEVMTVLVLFHPDLMRTFFSRSALTRRSAS